MNARWVTLCLCPSGGCPGEAVSALLTFQFTTLACIVDPELTEPVEQHHHEVAHGVGEENVFILPESTDADDEAVERIVGSASPREGAVLVGQCSRVAAHRFVRVHPGNLAGFCLAQHVLGVPVVVVLGVVSRVPEGVVGEIALEAAERPLGHTDEHRVGVHLDQVVLLPRTDRGSDEVLDVFEHCWREPGIVHYDGSFL